PMQNIIPVLCFIAGFGLAWLVLRPRRRETEAAFPALSPEAVERSQKAVADTVAPGRASLGKVDAQIQGLEKGHTGSYAGLEEHLRGLVDTQSQLRTETSRLVTALRTPSVRGHWGEIQLRRVVEMAGMLAHCDFCSQTTVNGDEGRLRPDLLVRLP